MRFVGIIICCIIICGCGPHTDEDNSLISQPEGIGYKSLYNPSEEDYYIADSDVGHLHKPNALREYNWPEHPDGKIIAKTNNLGFRNVADTKVEKGEETVRILVTGDSHMDGVIHNNESFPFHLQKLLSDSFPDKEFECLNGGVGYYGPQNYYRFLKKYLHLKPDVFVVTMYGGNDFLDGVRQEVLNNNLEVPERGDDYYEGLWKVDEEAPGFTGQLMNQTKFIATYPNFWDKMSEIAIYSIMDIKKVCDDEGIELVVLLLPTKADVEPQTDLERINKVADILELDSADMNINMSLLNDVERFVKASEYNYINYYSHWVSSETEYFWKSDYHLNHHGHKSMAEILFSDPLILKNILE